MNLLTSMILTLVGFAILFWLWMNGGYLIVEKPLEWTSRYINKK